MSGTQLPERRLLGRREALGRLGGGVAALGAAAVHGRALEAAEDAPAVKNGRINQSLVWWCFEKHWDIEKACQIAVRLGLSSIELASREHWPVLKKHRLTCALLGSHGFEKGMNNPRYQPECLAKMRQSIESSVEQGFPSVITFTGFREDIPDDVGIENCVKGYKEIVGLAEAKKVTLCLEMLNSRVAVAMKGHPGYQGDHVDYCMEIIRRVGSPRLKLLFDIYHVQIMDGDIISRIRQYREAIGPYHTAGNPGRCEIDDLQEINYRPILAEIQKGGYTGFVGQEFIPTRDPVAGLRQAVEICDV